MHRRLTLLIAVVCAAASAGQAGDPLKAPECQQALQAFEAEQERASGARLPGPAGAGDGRKPASPKLEALRRQAAKACLGSQGDAPPAQQRFTQPPIVVPPIAIPRMNGPAAPAPAAIGPPLKRVEPTTIVTGCDATGCWASDGSRLNRLGTELMGPRGPCRVQGVVVDCR